MWEMIEAGWPVLSVIGVLSVVALGFVVERLLAYRRARANTDEFFPKLEELVRLGRLDEAATLCEASPGLVPRVILTGLRAPTENVDEVKRILGDEIQMRAITGLERHLNKIAVIGRASPMLGLLGTVLGMIAMFGEIAIKGPGDMGALAGGIKLALGTTAAGLMVAIPIMFLHSWLKGQVRDLELELFTGATRFLGLMRLRSQVAGVENGGKSSVDSGRKERPKADSGERKASGAKRKASSKAESS